MKNKITGIYKITSPSGKIYIGQSVDIGARFARYKRCHCKLQARLYASFMKYGAGSHSFEIIKICQPSDLDDFEIKYIKQYDSTNSKTGLNLKYGGSHGCHNQETKNKIGKAHKGKIVSKAARINISIAQKKISEIKSEIASKWQTGRKLTETHKANLSKAKIGNKSKAGKKLSEKTKRLISEANKGHKYNLGKKRSDSEKKRISEMHKGKPKSEEQKLKTSIARKRWYANKKNIPDQTILLF